MCLSFVTRHNTLYCHEQLYLNRDYEFIGGRQPGETPEMRGLGGGTLGTRHPLSAAPPHPACLTALYVPPLRRANSRKPTTWRIG